MPVLVLLALLVSVTVALMLAAGAHARAERPRAATPPRELVRHALAVVPAAADREALRAAIDHVLATDPRVDVVVIEPQADDRPWLERPHPRITTLRPADAESPAAALRAGAARALLADYDAVIEMSVEHSRLACSTTALLEALDDGAHVAVGSRHVPGARLRGCASYRRALSRAANRLLAQVVRVPLRDVTARIRAYRRDALECGVLPAQGDGLDCAVEIVLRCRQAGLRFAEVPVRDDAAACATHSLVEGYAMLRRALAWRGRAAGGAGLLARMRPLTAVLTGR